MNLLPIFASVFCAAAAIAATPAETLLADGRTFVHALQNASSNDPSFATAGYDRVQAMLNAVLEQGQSRQASLDDWDDLHRALAGLIELYESRQEWLKASLYATFQHTYYRNHEGDYAHALIAARKSLDLVEKSGATGNLFLNWMDVGQDLLALAQVDEALDAFYNARNRITDPLGRPAAHLWRNIVHAELARHNIESARQEVARFQLQAGSKISYFRSQSEFAHADLLMATGEYSAVPAIIRAALAEIPNAAERESLSCEAANELMSCVLASMNTLTYPEAIGLASEIDRGIEGLPFSVSVFAGNAIRMRRRLAGDAGGLLRDDNYTLDAARKAGNVRLQIETLHSLAADFAASNSVANQITTLEEALVLERTVPSAGVELASANSHARTLVILGNAYIRNKEAGKARHCFAEIAKTADDQSSAAGKADLARLRAQATLGLAAVELLDDDFDAARDILQGALKDTGSSYDRADVLLRLARLDREDRPDAAHIRYQQAITAMNAARDRNTEIATRLEFAQFLAGTGQGKLATEQLRIVSAAASSALADIAWKSALLSGEVAESATDLNGAVKHYRDSVNMVEAIRSRFGGEEQRQSFIDNQYVSDLFSRLISALTRLGRHEEAWQYQERAKARVFVETLRGHRFRESVPLSAATEIAGIEKQILDARTALAPANEHILRGSGREPAVIDAELRQLEARLNLARQRVGLVDSRATQAVSVDPPSLRAVQMLLPKATVLVEFSLLPDSLTAFVISRTTSRQLHWSVDRNLRAKVVQLRSLLADRNSTDRLGALLAEVSAAIWSPVAAALPSRTTRLLLIPAAYLNYIPFHVLLQPGGGSLIDHFSISYLPSASTLTLLQRAAPSRPDGKLFLGALGTVSVEGWAPLPATLLEAGDIARIYPNAQRATGGEFTHDAAIDALQSYDRVHFATHGILDEHAPLFSALLVSPAPGQSTRLSLYELMDIHLKAKLVVLSACETGLGKLLGGDEVTSLTRTLLSAGASTVVSSLWKVSDASTAILMRGFYQRLHAGQTPAEAMRRSSLELRTLYKHPFYWAPFVVTGAS